MTGDDQYRQELDRMVAAIGEIGVANSMAVMGALAIHLLRDDLRRQVELAPGIVSEARLDAEMFAPLLQALMDAGYEVPGYTEEDVSQALLDMYNSIHDGSEPSSDVGASSEWSSLFRL